MLFVFECPTCRARIEADATASGRQAHCPQCHAMVAVPESRVDCGTTLGEFRLGQRLGKGGMGEVFLGTQLSVDRRVAVKILPPGFATDEAAVQRFLHEGRLAARLDHANIVKVHEAGVDTGHYYLAMAYVEGESLDQRLKREGALPEREALTIVRTVADALAYAWDEFQLLHRDLKPANIMLDRRGRVFLMDLGLAKSLGEESGMTLSGAILGTPHYMSPEQATGSTHLSVQTDIYALGATLYHLVVGAPPFTGDSALKVLNQHVHEPLPPPRSRNPQISEVCSQVITMMMAKQPGQRYPGWRDLIGDLDRLLAGTAPLEPAARSGQAAPAAVSAAAGRASLAQQAQAALARQHRAEAPAKAPAAAAKPPAGRAWRSPWVLGLAAAAALLVVVLVAVLVRGRGAAPAPLAQRGGKTSQTGPASPTSPTRPAGPTGPAQPVAAAAPQAAPEPAPQPAPPAPPALAPAGAPPAARPAPVAEPIAVAAPPPEQPPPPVAEAATAPATHSVLARTVLSGRPADALQRWREKGEELGRGLSEEQRQAVTAQLGALAGMDRQLLASLKADVGKTVEIELAKEKITGEVREVAADGIRINQVVRQGQGSATLGRTVKFAELSIAERLRRLGPGDTPELNLQRGLLALEAARPDTARKLFEKAGGPLGEALAAELKTRQADARETAAEQAVIELLRQISTSPKLDDRDKVVAAIRKRCGDDLKRVQAARKALAEFEKDYGDSAPGKEWAPVVRRGLAYPVNGDTPLRIPDLGIDMIPVTPGEFQMGSDGGDRNNRPAHKVRITEGFWMSRTEVTQQQAKAMGLRTDRSPFKGDSLPVGVRWGDSMQCCRTLTGREQGLGRLPEGYVYRLPTEAEWEFAARGGTLSKGYRYAGSNNLEEVAWCNSNSGAVWHPVGQLKANELGLCDMTGNVDEWCLDFFEEGYYSNSPKVDPLGPSSGTSRVSRGANATSGTRQVPADVFIRWSSPVNENSPRALRLVLAPPIPAASP